jgi:uncharacterized protein
MDDRLKAAALLVLSNTFMTVAWYGHLRFRKAPMLVAIVVSWGIAFFEYCAQVPANRIGYRVLSAYQLKIMQEAITLLAFIVFAAVWLGEGIQPKYLLSMAMISPPWPSPSGDGTRRDLRPPPRYGGGHANVRCRRPPPAHRRGLQRAGARAAADAADAAAGDAARPAAAAERRRPRSAGPAAGRRRAGALTFYDGPAIGLESQP